MLGFIISLVEYFSERKKAMEQFWIEARRVLAQFREAKYIHFDEPHELVLECITEHHYNKIAKQLPQGMAGVFGPEESHLYQEKYIKWMEEHETMPFTEKDDIVEILNQIYVSRMDNYEKVINGVINNYIELSKISLSELDSDYGNINFIFANNSIRLKAYDEIFSKLRLLKQKLLEETYHFNRYKNDKGNFAVCVKKAMEVSETLFLKEMTEQGAFDSICIYQKEFDDIEESLETFRTKIYYKEKKTPIERIPVSARMINFKDSEKNKRQEKTGGE